MRRSRPARPWRRTPLLSLAAVLALAGACSSSGDASPPPGSTPGTATTVPADLAAGATVPPRLRASPPGATTVEGLVLGTAEVGRVEGPRAIAARPGEPDLYIAEDGGRVKRVIVTRRFDRSGELTGVDYDVDSRLALDINRPVEDEGERGLLGLAFSIDGRKMFVSYTSADGALHVDSYTMDGDRADTRSQREILRIEHPEPTNYGGALGFGPDGFLYVALGDGGGIGDPQGHAENPETLEGGLLRVDPEGGTRDQAYDVPDGNPFKLGGGRGELWALWLRDPDGFSWDAATDDLWVTDDGEGTLAEVNLVPYRQGGAGRAANLGWSIFEGTRPYGGAVAPAGYVPPVFEYPLAAGRCGAVAGRVYRGQALPGLVGVYVYADRCGGELRGLLVLDDGTVGEGSLGVTVDPAEQVDGVAITAIGEDEDGELWLTTGAGGVFRITGAPIAPA